MTTPVCDALVAASTTVTDIVGELHALFFYGEDMSEARRQRIITDARAKTEKLLAAIVAAEQFIAPAARSEPSNVVQIGDHDKEYRNTLDTVASIVGAPQFDGAAS